MRHIKLIGLLSIALASSMAFAASSLATTVTSPTGTVYTSTFTAESEGTISWDGAFSTVSCPKSHFEAEVNSHGTGVTVTGSFSKLSFTECNFPFTVESLGSLEIHPVKTNNELNKVEACATSECTGTVTASGWKIKVHTSLGECVFTTTNTDIGLLTPSNDVTVGGKDSTATIDIGAHGTGTIPRTAGSFLCDSTSQLTGSYQVTTPDRLYVDA